MSDDNNLPTLPSPRLRERSSEDALHPGTVLAERYRIEAFIGQGGFGIAYVASCMARSERVVIKEYLPRELARRSRSNVGVVVGQSEHREIYDHGLASFLNEARLLQQFDAPSIVRVKEVFQENDTAYLVMPYEEGPTLSEMVKARHRFDENELRVIFMQLLEGLRVVHAAGYLHRDIKPSNIIIRSSDRRPILIDFGAARQALVERSRSISSMLTPGYAPFEQYPGYSKRQGRWSDLYSLGVTLYQAITHCTEDTLEQSNANVRLEALHTGAPDPLVPAVTAGAALCSQELLGIIDWLMRPRIEDRPQSIEEVQAALMGGRPVPAAAPLHPTQTRPQPSSTDTTLIAPKSKPAPAPRSHGLAAAMAGLVTVVGALTLGAWLIFPDLGKLHFLGNSGKAADLGGLIRSEQLRQSSSMEGLEQSAPPQVADTGVRPLEGDSSGANPADIPPDSPLDSAKSSASDAGAPGAGADTGHADNGADNMRDTPAASALQPHRYTLTVNPQPATARVEILNGGPRYRPGIELAPKRYRLRVTAAHYQPFEASLVLRSDVTASVKLCPYITQPGPPAQTVALPRSMPHVSVQNIADRINIPTATGGGELVRRTEAMLCVRAQKDLNERLASRCQGLGGQGVPTVNPCACQPVPMTVQRGYVVTQSCAVTGTVACSVPSGGPVTTAMPVQPPAARVEVDPSCPAPALSY